MVGRQFTKLELEKRDPNSIKRHSGEDIQFVDIRAEAYFIQQQDFSIALFLLLSPWLTGNKALMSLDLLKL